MIVFGTLKLLAEYSENFGLGASTGVDTFSPIEPRGSNPLAWYNQSIAIIVHHPMLFIRHHIFLKRENEKIEFGKQNPSSFHLHRCCRLI